MTKKVRSKKGGKLWRELPEDLIPAAKEGNIDLLKASLRNEATDINARDANGLNALLWAAKLNNNDDVVRHLLEKDADVDELDETGMNALAIAVARRKKNIVKALLEDGRSDQTDIDGNELDRVAGFGGGKKSQKRKTNRRRIRRRKTRRRSKKGGIGQGLPEELIPAAKEGNIKMVEAALRNEATDVDMMDDDGLTALLWAAKLNNNDDVVRHLLAKGADVDALDLNAENALSIAVMGRKSEIVKALLEDGHSDPNEVDRNGHSPLFRAILAGDSKMIEVMLDSDNIRAASMQRITNGIRSRSFQEAKKLVDNRVGLKKDGWGENYRTNTDLLAIIDGLIQNAADDGNRDNLMQIKDAVAAAITYREENGISLHGEEPEEESDGEEPEGTSLMDVANRYSEAELDAAMAEGRGGKGRRSKGRRSKGRRTKGRRTKGRKSKGRRSKGRGTRRRKNKRRSSRRKIGSRSGGGPGGFSIKPKSQMIREKTDCCNSLISSTQNPNATLEGDCKNWFGAMTRKQCVDRQACIARGGWSC